jgi:hypothetical protein
MGESVESNSCEKLVAEARNSAGTKQRLMKTDKTFYVLQLQ